jgi:hypothetical protein
VTSCRNFSSVRRGAERFRTTGWLAACGGAASRARAKAQLRIGAAAGVPRTPGFTGRDGLPAFRCKPMLGILIVSLNRRCPYFPHSRPYPLTDFRNTHQLDRWSLFFLPEYRLLFKVAFAGDFDRFQSFSQAFRLYVYVGRTFFEAADYNLVASCRCDRNHLGIRRPPVNVYFKR